MELPSSPTRIPLIRWRLQPTIRCNPVKLWAKRKVRRRHRHLWWEPRGPLVVHHRFPEDCQWCRHSIQPRQVPICKAGSGLCQFPITDTCIEPQAKFLEAIRDFPTPTSTTNIHSWFGLVNKVTNYTQLRDIMAPFKPFLSQKKNFFWTPVLEGAFQPSKAAIVEAIREGVIFDTSKLTCLRPDWSTSGIGISCSRNAASVPREFRTFARTGGALFLLAPASSLVQSWDTHRLK